MDRFVVNFNYRDGDKLVSLQEVKVRFWVEIVHQMKTALYSQKTVVQCGFYAFKML